MDTQERGVRQVLADEVHLALWPVCQEGSLWEFVHEVINRLRDGGMSELSIRQMLVLQKPVQGPPPDWPGPQRPAPVFYAWDIGKGDVEVTIHKAGSGDQEMASDVVEVQRALTHEDELRAERLRTGTDEERMRKGFSGRVG